MPVKQNFFPQSTSCNHNSQMTNVPTTTSKSPITEDSNPTCLSVDVERLNREYEVTIKFITSESSLESDFEHVFHHRNALFRDIENGVQNLKNCARSSIRKMDLASYALGGHIFSLPRGHIPILHVKNARCLMEEVPVVGKQTLVISDGRVVGETGNRMMINKDSSSPLHVWDARSEVFANHRVNQKSTALKQYEKPQEQNSMETEPSKLEEPIVRNKEVPEMKNQKYPSGNAHILYDVKENNVEPELAGNKKCAPVDTSYNHADSFCANGLKSKTDKETLATVGKSFAPIDDSKTNESKLLQTTISDERSTANSSFPLLCEKSANSSTPPLVSFSNRYVTVRKNGSTVHTGTDDLSAKLTNMKEQPEIESHEERKTLPITSEIHDPSQPSKSWSKIVSKNIPQQIRKVEYVADPLSKSDDISSRRNNGNILTYVPAPKNAPNIDEDGFITPKSTVPQPVAPPKMQSYIDGTLETKHDDPPVISPVTFKTESEKRQSNSEVVKITKANGNSTEKCSSLKNSDKKDAEALELSCISSTTENTRQLGVHVSKQKYKKGVVIHLNLMDFTQNTCFLIPYCPSSNGMAKTFYTVFRFIQIKKDKDKSCLIHNLLIDFGLVVGPALQPKNESNTNPDKFVAMCIECRKHLVEMGLDSYWLMKVFEIPVELLPERADKQMDVTDINLYGQFVSSVFFERSDMAEIIIDKVFKLQNFVAFLKKFRKNKNNTTTYRKELLQKIEAEEITKLKTSTAHTRFTDIKALGMISQLPPKYVELIFFGYENNWMNFVTTLIVYYLEKNNYLSVA